MKFYKNTQPIIIHFPGKANYKNENLISFAKNTKIKISEDIPESNKYTIMSPITKNVLDISPLHNQLVANNIDYVNPAISYEDKWHRNVKPILIYESLKSITTPYCLIIDGKDSVIVNDLIDIAEILKVYNKKIIYNGTHANLKNESEDDYFNKLNAGAVFGDTEELRKLYGAVVDMINSKIYKIDSEQFYVIRYFIKHSDIVGIDTKGLVFQTGVNNE